MSDAMRDDYFSYMSNQSTGRAIKQLQRVAAESARSSRRASNPDVIDFVDESQMEVTESFVSETTIQRIFRGPSDA